ncbi:hypothetical protein BZA77DRAFT_56641 [Pyronema omphalodes]|nr:hypothetical protein BZA77DRAFT_56641 [Pyronema omphalodes]
MTLVITKPPQAYQISPTSSVASSVSSVWSVQSATSSRATSVYSTVETPSTTVLPTLSEPAQPIRRATAPIPRGFVDNNGCYHPHPALDCQSQQPLPIEQRQNPRRTNRLVDSTTTLPCPAATGCALPVVPVLQRQAERKVNFVENLVDSAAQIVETIWHKYDLARQQKDVAVLPLRTFIQETLRRSRTSYSTLQVALYYLIVIRPHLPVLNTDCSGLSTSEIQLVRAKQCGRRMFLAALILASKYLQDRNYSARAWSKISGLSIQEINVNEMAFLKAIDWKLHISEAVFQKWTDLVLKYTTSPGSSSPTITISTKGSTVEEDNKKKEWSDLIMRLSPDLSEVYVPPSNAAHPQIEFGPTVSPVESAPTPVSQSTPLPLRQTHSMPIVPTQQSRTLESQVPPTYTSQALPQQIRRLSPTHRSTTGTSTPAASPHTRVVTPSVEESTPKAIPTANRCTGRSPMVNPRGGSEVATVSTYRKSSIASLLTHDHPIKRKNVIISTPQSSSTPFIAASPRMHVAAIALSTLRYSPQSRKRSCPSIYSSSSSAGDNTGSSGVTPMFRGLNHNSGYASPSAGGRCVPSPMTTASPYIGGREGKRRCEWQGNGLEAVPLALPAN